MPTDFKLLSGAGTATKLEIVATMRPVVDAGRLIGTCIEVI
jgi:hypothetical protein